MRAGGGRRPVHGAGGLEDLDRLSGDELRSALTACCGAARWVDEMVAARPFGDRDTLLRKADEIWWSLGPDDWREAFARHPRIGERDARAGQDPRASAWSAGEQRSMTDASLDVRAAIADGNREYERRFGHIYIVSAAGKTAAELLELLQARLMNDPVTELQVAAAEQAKITRSRLARLVAARENESETSRRSTLRPPSSTLE